MSARPYAALLIACRTTIVLLVLTTIDGARWLVPAPSAFAVVLTSAVVCLLAAVSVGLLPGEPPRVVRRGSVPGDRDVPSRGRAAAVGAGIGCVVVGSVAGLLALTSVYAVRLPPIEPSGVLAAVVAFAVTTAVVEELAFRRVLLAALAPHVGPVNAVFLVALAFGFAHALNPAATAWTSFALAVGPGILFGSVVLWTRRVSAAIGAHAAWNATQIVLGIPLSGLRLPGLIQLDASGGVDGMSGAALTGGAFGLEASVILVVVSGGVGLVLLRRASRRVAFPDSWGTVRQWM